MNCKKCNQEFKLSQREACSIQTLYCPNCIALAIRKTCMCEPDEVLRITSRGTIKTQMSEKCPRNSESLRPHKTANRSDLTKLTATDLASDILVASMLRDGVAISKGEHRYDILYKFGKIIFRHKNYSNSRRFRSEKVAKRNLETLINAGYRLEIN